MNDINGCLALRLSPLGRLRLLPVAGRKLGCPWVVWVSGRILGLRPTLLRVTISRLLLLVTVSRLLLLIAIHRLLLLNAIGRLLLLIAIRRLLLLAPYTGCCCW